MPFGASGAIGGLSMETVVLSLGGSVLPLEEGTRPSLEEIAALLRRVSREVQLYVVTGGGPVARSYIHTARTLGVSEPRLDELGIWVTRLNAQFLAHVLGEEVPSEIPVDWAEAEELGKTHRLIVMGGVRPGTTTDGVAAVLAERVHAVRLVNATAVDGIYSSDPRHDPKATLREKMSYAELRALTGDHHRLAGPNIVFDPLGAQVVERAKIPLFVVNGRNLDNLERAILGQPFHGTRVSVEA